MTGNAISVPGGREGAEYARRRRRGTTLSRPVAGFRPGVPNRNAARVVHRGPAARDGWPAAPLTLRPTASGGLRRTVPDGQPVRIRRTHMPPIRRTLMPPTARHGGRSGIIGEGLRWIGVRLHPHHLTAAEGEHVGDCCFMAGC